MKKLIISIITLFVVTLFSFGQREGNEAYNELTSIQRIMLQASEEVIDAENQLNLEIVHLEFDLLLGDGYKYCYRDLSKGWVYVMYAEGENNQVSDLDMKVLRQNPVTNEWEEVGEDKKETFSAIVFTEVKETSRYAIGVKVAKYETGFRGCHYFVLIAHAKPE